jgi:hypothetical protein
VVAHLLDLGEQVRGEQHGRVSVAAQAPDQLPHVADAGGVQSVARLVDSNRGDFSSAAALPRRCFMPRE